MIDLDSDKAEPTMEAKYASGGVLSINKTGMDCTNLDRSPPFVLIGLLCSDELDQVVGLRRDGALEPVVD